jgi:hypothetical protein
MLPVMTRWWPCDRTIRPGRAIAADPATAPPAADREWLRFDLSVTRPAPGLYRALAGAAREMLSGSGCDDLFFVHGLPGIRLHCHPSEWYRPAVEARCRRLLADLAGRRLVRAWRDVGHEPDRRLPGEPAARRLVHRVFTADSVTWLGFHAAAPPGGWAPIANWAMSVLMIRCLPGPLRVPGWESTDAWDRICRDGQQAPAPHLSAGQSMQQLGASIRGGWADPVMLRLVLPPAAQVLLAGYEADVRAAAREWAAGYRTTAGPHPVWQRAVDLVIGCHWNRAGLPSYQQVLIGDALMRVRADPFTAVVTTGPGTWPG